MRTRTEFLIFSVVALALTACAGPTFAPDDAPEFLVARDAPFYHLGPQQAEPPEAILHKNDRLRLLRKEFGFSFVQISDGQTGYVGNEILLPAAPRPKPPVRSQDSPQSEVAPLPVSEEPPLPKPDLQAPPPDAPASR